MYFYFGWNELNSWSYTTESSKWNFITISQIPMKFNFRVFKNSVNFAHEMKIHLNTALDYNDIRRPFNKILNSVNKTARKQGRRAAKKSLYLWCVKKGLHFSTWWNYKKMSSLKLVFFQKFAASLNVFCDVTTRFS